MNRLQEVLPAELKISNISQLAKNLVGAKFSEKEKMFIPDCCSCWPLWRLSLCRLLVLVDNLVVTALGRCHGLSLHPLWELPERFNDCPRGCGPNCRRSGRWSRRLQVRHPLYTHHISGLENGAIPFTDMFSFCGPWSLPKRMLAGENVAIGEEAYKQLTFGLFYYRSHNHAFDNCSGDLQVLHC